MFFKFLLVFLFLGLQNIYAEEDSQIIYAPQLAITEQDIENALNYISKAYVNLTFTYNSGANNNTLGSEFFATNEYIYAKGELNINQDSSISYMQLDPKILIYGDMRYYSFNIAGSYIFYDNTPYMFLGLGITSPLFSVSYQKQYETSYDRFYVYSQRNLFIINKIVYVSFVGKLDYIYQNKYVKVNPAIYVNFNQHSVGFEYTYSNLYFNNSKNLFSLVYKISL